MKLLGCKVLVGFVVQQHKITFGKFISRDSFPPKTFYGVPKGWSSWDVRSVFGGLMLMKAVLTGKRFYVNFRAQERMC